MGKTSKELLEQLKEIKDLLAKSKDEQVKENALIAYSTLIEKNNDNLISLNTFVLAAKQLGYEVKLVKEKQEKDLLDTKLEDTHLFNYLNEQSFSYNYFKEKGINTIRDLLNYTTNNKISESQSLSATYNNNILFPANELNGIVDLIKYAYMGVKTKRFEYLFKETITSNNWKIDLSKSNDSLYLLNIYNRALKDKDKRPVTYNNIINTLGLFKCFGFDQTAVKTLIDIAYDQKLDNMPLGEFLDRLDEETLNKYFTVSKLEYNTFINILTIVKKYYKEIKKENVKSI